MPGTTTEKLIDRHAKEKLPSSTALRRIYGSTGKLDLFYPNFSPKNEIENEGEIGTGKRWVVYTLI
jgi:hypothetical protein